MTEELKRCPFCGDEPEIELIQSIFGYSDWMIICPKCLIKMWDEDKATVIAAWNTRHESDDLIRTVKTRINELEEQIEVNCTYRSRELVNHEIVVLKWVLSLRRGE